MISDTRAYLGSHIARAICSAKPLAGKARVVQLSARHPDRVYKTLSQTLSQDQKTRLVQPVPVDITKPETLAPAFRDASVVVSLVGILHGTPEAFERIQWRGAQNVARAAHNAGAKLVHISAIGANPESELAYERTKGLGEQAVLEACPNATVIRPSIVFGPEDDFFNVSAFLLTLTSWSMPRLTNMQRFARLSKFLPFMPVFGGGNSLFQPVYVGDVSEAVEIISRDDKDIRQLVNGKIIEAGGPDGKHFITKETNHTRSSALFQ